MKLKASKTQRMVFDALLAGISLIIFIVELSLPSLTPIPGIKLGLSNIISLMTMYLFGPIDALAVLLVRIFLGCLLSGQIMALAYSLAGGLFSYLLMLCLRKVLADNQIFICSILCAIAHNAGQILIAVLLTKTTAVFFYFPVLCVSAIVAGLFTGLCAQCALRQMKKIL